MTGTLKISNLLYLYFFFFNFRYRGWINHIPQFMAYYHGRVPLLYYLFTSFYPHTHFHSSSLPQATILMYLMYNACLYVLFQNGIVLNVLIFNLWKCYCAQQFHSLVYTEENWKLNDYTKKGTWIFIAALCVIAKNWKQFKCPSADEWINKMLHGHTVECDQPWRE